MTSDVADAAPDPDESPVFRSAIRLGFVAYGLVHLVVAWLALQLAFGSPSGSASQQGALQQLAAQPFGRVLVWVMGIGMFALVAWSLLDALLGHREERDDRKRLVKRLTSAGKAVVYGVLGASAVKIAAGAGSGGGSQHTTAELLGLPGGQVIVGLVGVGVLVVGGVMVYRGWTEKFAQHLSAEGRSGDAGTLYLMLGRVGYVAKGVAIGIIGVLFVVAAFTHDAKESGGLDVALHRLVQQPFGVVLLVAVALGLAAFGLFTFARARHLRT